MKIKFLTKASVMVAIRQAGFSVNYLLSVGVDSKTVKGEKMGIITGIMYLTPSTKNCAGSTAAGCLKNCLYGAGRAKIFLAIPAAREERTRLFDERPDLFFALLQFEVDALGRKAEKQNMKMAVRLNGTSDLDWSEFITANPNTQFYDYSKIPNRVKKMAHLDNYHLSLSYSAANPNYANAIIKAAKETKTNVVVVFRKEKPIMWQGLPVIDGDESDLRFLDQPGVIVGLKAKGAAKQDTSGFVVDI